MPASAPLLDGATEGYRGVLRPATGVVNEPRTRSTVADGHACGINRDICNRTVAH